MSMRQTILYSGVARSRCQTNFHDDLNSAGPPGSPRLKVIPLMLSEETNMGGGYWSRLGY
jgi:hypothetical protein